MPSLTLLATQYVNERRRRGEIAPRTAKNLRSVLDGFARSYGDRPVTRMGAADVRRWMETTTHQAPSTSRLALSTVRGFCAWLVTEGHLEADPTEGIKRPKQPRSVPRAMRTGEVARLLAACPDMRARAIVNLMVGCGLRCVEVARLGVTDYDPQSATLAVIGKGGHQRVLPVPQQVQEDLDRYLASVGVVAGPLIRAYDRPWRGLDAGTISLYVSRWMAEAGLKHGRWDGRSAHALRHTAASDVLDVCGDLRVVQEMLGHTNVAVTSIYLRRANLGQMRDAMEGAVQERTDRQPERPYLRAA